MPKKWKKDEMTALMKAVSKYKTENVSVDFSDPQVRKNKDVFDGIYKYLDDRALFEEGWPIEGSMVKFGMTYYEYTKHKRSKPTGNITKAPVPNTDIWDSVLGILPTISPRVLINSSANGIQGNEAVDTGDINSTIEEQTD